MLILKLIVGNVMQMLILGGLLFLPAGTLDWWRAWFLIGIFTAGSAASTFGLFPEHKDLLLERLKSPVQKGQPLTDKIILVIFIISFYGLIVFIPLDVFRFHLMARPAIIVSSLGLLFFLVGWRIVYLALKENSFAAPVVKLQEERHQKVIDTGVYGVVRHPMYAGGILFIAGIPLWLESYAATLLAIIPIGAIVLRILLVEEKFLKQELKGYGTYMKRVRYRLIPFLW